MDQVEIVDAQGERVELVALDAAEGELSALLPCRRRELLEAYGFDYAFWAARDDLPAERALILLGHRRGKAPEQGWKLKPLKAKVAKPEAGETDDPEALAWHAGWIYVFGSQFGSKKGPLDLARAFVARWREDELDGKLGRARPRMEVLLRPFALHRAINDALVEARIPLIPLGPHVAKRFIEDSLRRAAKRQADHATDLRVEDYPINVEGAVFAADGSCLLGLRFPTTREGQPLLLRLEGIPQAFADPAQRLRAQVAAIIDTGSREQPLGIRALQAQGDQLHLLAGPIGSVDKPNAVALDYPGSQTARCTHLRCAWPRWERMPQTLRVETVHDCVAMRVEGLAAAPDGRWHYVVDTPDGVLLGVGRV